MVTDRLFLQVDLARVALKDAYVKSRSFRLDDALAMSRYRDIIFELGQWQDALNDATSQLRECIEAFADAHYSGGHDHV
jgi:hypothetical protein